MLIRDRPWIFQYGRFGGGLCEIFLMDKVVKFNNIFGYLLGSLPAMNRVPKFDAMLMDINYPCLLLVSSLIDSLSHSVSITHSLTLLTHSTHSLKDARTHVTHFSFIPFIHSSISSFELSIHPSIQFIHPLIHSSIVPCIPGHYKLLILNL